MFYSVVLLDGNELHCLSLEEVQILFFKRQINQDSLVCTAEEGKWQLLKRTFDLSEWIPSGNSAETNGQSDPANNPFAAAESQPPAFESATTSSPPPVTFNQFPADQPSQTSNQFASNASNGYSQNNQTETYYQAETNQTNYNFQNNPANFAPSKYSNAGGYGYAPDYSASAGNYSTRRRGLGVVAFFLFFNALFYVGLMIVGNLVPEASSENGSAAFGSGRRVGGFLPIIINLLLAYKLWKSGDGEAGRKWGLALSYFVLIVICILAPLLLFSAGAMLAGAYILIAGILYFASMATILHGKQSPSSSRIAIGIVSYVLYFLIVFGGAGLTFVGQLVPDIAKIKLKNSQIEKFKVEGKEFEDKTTGAKIVLPEGWSMIKLDNPVISSPEARMIAIDKDGNRLTMFEVVPVPGDLDMKRMNSTSILDHLADGVVEGLQQEVAANSAFGKNSVHEITRLSIFIGKHPAKLIVVERTQGGEKSKAHLIITYDELTFYVLHSWCPAEEYEQAQTEFTFFEKNFSVPDKINSAFTQTAENDKNR